MWPWRSVLGAMVVAIQIAMIARAAISNQCALWTPFHETALYRVEVETNTRRLDGIQALEYLQLQVFSFSEKQNRNWETNCMSNIAHLIEHQLKQNQELQSVIVTSSTNGANEVTTSHKRQP